MDDRSGTGSSITSVNVTEPPCLPVAPLPIAPAEPLLDAARRHDPLGDGAAGGTKRAFWLNHADQLVLALLSVVLLVLLAAYWMRLTRWGTVPIEIEHLEPRQLDFRIDVNSATWVEWGQLDGIGDALARRIVADRRQNGPFRSIADLRRVKGIGPRTLERIRPWLSIEAERDTPQAPAPRRAHVPP